MLEILGEETQVRFVSIRLRNFLSFREVKVDLSDFTALIGMNASGKSNFVSAIKLLREIPTYGLPIAVARRGGFDQLRHRSQGRPFDPFIEITFVLGENARLSKYSLSFRSVRGKRYEIKEESAEVYWRDDTYRFTSDGVAVRSELNEERDESPVPVSPGQSALGSSGGLAGYVLFVVLRSMQTVELNTARMREIQELTSTEDFESDGSNVASIYESLTPRRRSELVAELQAVVPSIARIDVEGVSDRQTLTFAQSTDTGIREFRARQMSDGTLRAFGILLAANQTFSPSMLVVEEPETAVHLGAMSVLTNLLLEKSTAMQVVVTTHSAELIDMLDPDSLRVVQNKSGESRISKPAPHTLQLIRGDLARPGELLQLNAIDADRESE